MIFYACPACGRWKNLSLAKALADAFTRIGNAALASGLSPDAVRCDVCLCTMTVISATDRVTVRAAPAEEKQGKQ